jgi:hypothetical protein
MKAYPHKYNKVNAHIATIRLPDFNVCVILYVADGGTYINAYAIK